MSQFLHKDMFTFCMIKKSSIFIGRGSLLYNTYSDILAYFKWINYT